MKLFLLIPSLFISLTFVGQVESKKLIEFAFKDKEVILYKDIRYNVADTLERLSRIYEIYLVKVDTCVPNFCRVKSYYTLPYVKNKQESNESYWVECENLETALHNSFSIYKKPFLTDENNVKLKVEDYSDIYFNVDIVSVKEDWVQIKFKINDQSLIGWVNKISLCPLKHADCN